MLLLFFIRPNKVEKKSVLEGIQRDLSIFLYDSLSIVAIKKSEVYKLWKNNMKS